MEKYADNATYVMRENAHIQFVFHILQNFTIQNRMMGQFKSNVKI
jgi:hypothetical protein